MKAPSRSRTSKSLAALIAGAALAVGVAACGGGSASPDTADVPPFTVPTATAVVASAPASTEHVQHLLDVDDDHADDRHDELVHQLAVVVLIVLVAGLDWRDFGVGRVVLVGRLERQLGHGHAVPAGRAVRPGHRWRRHGQLDRRVRQHRRRDQRQRDQLRRRLQQRWRRALVGVLPAEPGRLLAGDLPGTSHRK